MNEIRIGLAGLGSRGLYTLLLLQRLKGFRVVALCDSVAALHAKGLEALRNRDAIQLYTDYEKFLADSDMDAVMLTVRCKEQGAMAAMALEAGKHVNSEVPAAHSIEDCWRIVVAQEKSGKVYHLGEQTRYWGFVDAWRKLVAEGRLGHISLCEGQYFHYLPDYFYRVAGSGQTVHPSELPRHPDAKRTWVHDMPPIHYLPHELSPMLKALDDRDAAFRDAILENKPLEFDVYRAMDTAVPAILAAESIQQGTKLIGVPDFRPNRNRPKGQMPR